MVSNSAILKALIYSDIFNFPLTKEEIWKFLIGRKINRKSFEEELKNLQDIKFKNNYYYLAGREKILEKRIKREKESRKKLDLANKIVEKLSIIPTVLFIGISGSLALENSDEKDDIDLFIITSKNTLWITRLTLVVLLILMGQYRGRGKEESQKVCLNMLIDENSLSFPKTRQDLYTAHEITQLKPILDRNNTYNKFLSANKWVTKFLPNSVVIKKLRNEVIKERKGNYRITQLLNYFAKVLQLWYMRGHRTNETINDKMLAFHPFEYKDYVLEEYNKRLKRYEI